MATYWQIAVHSVHDMFFHGISNFLSVGIRASCLLLGPPGFNWCFSFSVRYLAPMDLHRWEAY